jgi:UDP-glucose 4-epimerase
VSYHVLVAGAAGYIGSAVCHVLVERGYSVVGMDTLQQGHRDALPDEVALFKGDILDGVTLERLFLRYPIEAVIHLAAASVVGESVRDPRVYFHNNVVGTLALLEAMLKFGVLRIVFSSSAAVYGMPELSPIPEAHPIRPVNPYGATKAAMEAALKFYGEAYGLRSVSLRYFNAAGALGRCGEDHRPETHLIPNIMKVALGQGEVVSIFGSDYSTPDGTAVRDYVHVEDIAQAHLVALGRLELLPHLAYNLGLGQGFSVREVLDTARRVIGLRIPGRDELRRAGDPPVLVADPSSAVLDLDWKPKHKSLEAILESAWHWHRDNPYGYLGVG